MTDTLNLRCGCIASIADETLVFEPCSDDCPNYVYVLAESAYADVPVRHTYPEDEKP